MLRLTYGSVAGTEIAAYNNHGGKDKAKKGKHKSRYSIDSHSE
jgi:hypothetical protein